MLKGEQIHFTYGAGTANEMSVLKNVSFQIEEGDFIGLIGVSGSGKTTLVKHMNGLLRATGGGLFFRGENVYGKKYPLSKLRKEVGLVFQYPEQQLFEKTVLKDVMYGPCNLGMTKEEAEASAKESLCQVGLDASCYHVSPLELSGGQKRSVAIAGVLAMNPSILILDEPAAGLDPYTKRQVFDLILKIQKKRNLAVVLVSHHMEDVAVYANRVWVMHQGELVLQGSPIEIFSQTERLKEMNIGVPQITSVTEKLIRNGLPLERVAVSVDDAENMILQMLNRRKAR
ncbi:energy-coupling factor transporter ATPase [Sporofaciens musculi]|uniref:energy-coupling factor transporter ATPase n=1 Tax=Sporofaciens musculi TaxID=2681861 RepID=UPI0025A023CD|nr:energy-coupling factor transporter ATPase [Sporofaciens musculi]